MDHYADDLKAVTDHLNLKDAIHVGHSTGGGQVVRYLGRHGDKNVAKAAIISAVPPLMVKTPANPLGLPKSVFDDLQAQLAANRAKFYYDLPAGPFYGFNRPGVKTIEPLVWNWWRQGMMGGAKAGYDGIVAFSQTDFTEDLKKISVPVLVMHSEDDQIVPYQAAGPLSAKLLKNGTLKTYKDLPHGMITTQADVINADLLAFFKALVMNAQSLGISRRRFIASTGLAATAVCFVPHRLFGAEQNLVAGARASGAKAKIATQALRGNVSALIGSGGNIAVLPGSDGKLIIDSGYLSSREKIAAALDGISRDPMKHLVNTHWHFDHTDGNEWMHSAGATITAHENTKKRLSTSTRVDDWNFTFPPSPAARFQPRSPEPTRRFTLMAQPSRLSITVRRTPMAISRSILPRLMSCTLATPGGMDISHSSIIRLAETLTA